MNDALLVCGLKRFANVPRNLKGFLQRNRPTLQSIGKRLSIDKLEHQKTRTVCFRKIVDRSDIG